MTKTGWHEDTAAVVIGMAMVILALAVTWQARPPSQGLADTAHPDGRQPESLGRGAPRCHS